MSKRGIIEFLSDIKEAIKRIRLYTNNMDYESFLKDIKVQDAVVRNLEIMGEATKSLPGEIRNKYPQIPWKELAGVRDRLIHLYFGVNYDIVWDIVKKELPNIFLQIEEILNKETADNNNFT